jgi:acetolactate synthase-1/2/3 large subunit
VPRLFAVAADGPLQASALRAGIDVVLTSAVESACVMAAITGDIVGNPAALLLHTTEEARRAHAPLAAALAERSPLVCFGPVDERVATAVKAVVDAGAASAAHWVAHAIHLSRKSPRGPVYVTASEGFSAHALPVATVVQPIDPPAPDAAALDGAAAAIRSATRPVIIVGAGGRSDAASSWLRAFAEALPAPVLATWKGKGALSDPHPLSFGVVGTTAPAVSVLEHADLLVAVGLDELERPVLDRRKPVVELGAVDSEADGEDATSRIACVPGDTGTILAELASRLPDTRSDWDVARLDGWKRQLDPRRAAASHDLARLVAFVREAMPAGAIAAFEPSRHDGAVAWDCVAPEDVHVLARSHLDGFAFPAAVAAALARPSAVALAFTDHANLAVSQEALVTAARLRRPVGVIVTGNGERAREVGEAPVAFVTAASERALAAALSRLLAERGPLVIDATGMRPVASV